MNEIKERVNDRELCYEISYKTYRFYSIEEPLQHRQYEFDNLSLQTFCSRIPKIIKTERLDFGKVRADSKRKITGLEAENGFSK